MKISEQELKIFSRHLILKEFNEKFFNKLQKQSVTIVGLGGVGCCIAQYLVATGIKKLKLIDGDKIDKTNLNRQILYSIQDIGKLKTEISKKKLLGINPECKITTINKFLNSKNLDNYLNKSSIIIDATDNWKSMLLTNKYCVKKSKPLISCSVLGFDGQVILFKNRLKKHLCLQCIFPNKNEPDLARCETVGILGTAAGMTALIATQKLINFFLPKKNNKDYITMINLKTLLIDHILIKKNISCQYLKKH